MRVPPGFRGRRSTYYEGYVVDRRVVDAEVYSAREPVFRDVSVTVTDKDGKRRGTTVRTALAP